MPKIAAGPACAVCAGAPLLYTPLLAMGLWGPAVFLHELLWFLAPLNAVLAWRSFRRHGRLTGLVVAGVGTLLILLHLGSHHVVAPEGVGEMLAFGIYPGTMLLAAGLLLDWRAQRTLTTQPASVGISISTALPPR